MKLYFAPGTCALSPHTVLRELGLPFTLVKVDIKSKKTASGGNYLGANPKGYVPLLELDDGRTLSEGPAIVQYLADLKPAAQLAPPNGTFERSRLHEWLNFISTEIHKSFSPLFNPAMPDAAKMIFKEKILQRFGYVSQTLATQGYLMGDTFGVADAYLFAVTRWAYSFDIDLNRWPPLARFMERVEARPAVQAALETESQAKKAA